jgi:hypothetical protein
MTGGSGYDVAVPSGATTNREIARAWTRIKSGE